MSATHQHKTSHSAAEAVVAKGHSGCNGKSKEKPFKGYTLEEMRYRKVVTQLKIEVARERLMMAVSPKVKGEAQTISSYVRGFDTAMRYADIAMLAYSIMRKVGNFFSFFAGRKRK